MTDPRKLILENSLSPGDIVMLTAAVRDLHLTNPGKFMTDVRTPCGELWENNCFITPLCNTDRAVEVIECEYPLIHRSNSAPFHFIHGFPKYLSAKLGVPIEVSEFKGDIRLSDQEKGWISQVHEIVGQEVPFWIIVAGGKRDFTIKWWEHRRYQEVVRHFRGKLLFVQVGEQDHCHKGLEGVIDLRGRTTLRQLVRLVYHSQGVLCPVTLLMHLAAAVETKRGAPKNRACVVVAGGREPMQWEAYPHHQFIHTNGALLCCDNGGCWRSRVMPLGDGDEKDEPPQLCLDVIGRKDRQGELIHLPRCMDMISVEEVIRRVEIYERGGAIPFLSTQQASLVRRATN